MLAYETDVTKTVDPFAGSYVVESLTDDVEAEALRLMDQVAERGGAVAAIEQGFQKSEIERSAYEVTREIDCGERVIVGREPLRAGRGGAVRAAAGRPGHRSRAGRTAGHAAGRAGRDRGRPRRSTSSGRRPRGTDNVLVPLKQALALRATVGEVCDALREVWGTYQPTERF